MAFEEFEASTTYRLLRYLSQVIPFLGLYNNHPNIQLNLLSRLEDPSLQKEKDFLENILQINFDLSTIEQLLSGIIAEKHCWSFQAMHNPTPSFTSA